ncbi:PREDICTED: vinorine synthase-like [Erythranthe guttata]|uniref:vinorine synthase-like n=1 Tax=Erythranthe guttata TaxID=4155 RepID=UPI00064D8534|nr:PREDICTED: vinorine synthase-like [Erythranthe guttata]|eukprot:XP_012837903.1 PREDICTED: vinorine synthase-like [Erythranthe guttata]
MEEKHLKQYIPCSDRYHSTCISNRPLFLVQVTCFDCGGIAVGVSFLHKIADLASVMAFMGAWAGACRGEGGDEVSRVSFNLADFFPAKDSLGSNDSRFPESDENFVTKRFVFDKEKLRALKEAAINPSGSTTVKNPTRIELVSSFIWKHLIDFSKHKNGAKRRIVVGASHAANLRPRKNILENMFGNCIIISSAFTDSANANELQELVGKLRRCIRKINDDYITESQSGDRALNDLQELYVGDVDEVGDFNDVSESDVPEFEVIGNNMSLNHVTNIFGDSDGLFDDTESHDFLVDSEFFAYDDDFNMITMLIMR